TPRPPPTRGGGLFACSDAPAPPTLLTLTPGTCRVTHMAYDDTPVHSEDVTVSVTVRVTAFRPEEDGIYSVAQSGGGERILGYIRQRNDGWYWARPNGGYPPVW